MAPGSRPGAFHGIQGEAKGSMRRISSVSILARDADRLSEFYTRALAASFSDHHEAGRGSGPLAFVQADRAVRSEISCGFLEIVEVPGLRASPRRAANAPGIRHVCFQSPYGDPVLGKLERGGWEAMSRGTLPINLGGTGNLYAYGLDPEGNIIEAEMLASYSHKSPVWFGHVSIVAKDIDRLVSFYEALLGSGPYRRLERSGFPGLDRIADLDGVSLRMAWFMSGGIGLELIQYDSPKVRAVDLQESDRLSGYYMMGLETASIEGERGRLGAIGAEILDPSAVPGRRQPVCARDPEGNLFTVSETAKEPEIAAPNEPHCL